MTRNFLITILFLLVAERALTQVDRTNHWYFGYYAGLDFTSGVPVAVKGSLTTDEGCAAISTPAGRLLFYTDGITVWDSIHTIMPNGQGLFSNKTSTQAAIIIPFPTDSEKYYIVTADQGGYVTSEPVRGINYSVVDMHLNNGRGDVTLKNVLLLPPPATEKLTATYHCNRKDVWVVAHGFKNNKFYAWLITAGGISVPIISSVGSVHGPDLTNTVGYMKFSPNGKKLALAATGLGNSLVELFDFDNGTGVVSSAISLPVTAGADDCNYGISFSPDNSRLYVSHDCIASRLYQYNLKAGNGRPDSIRKSKTLIAFKKNIYSALQLAPDGKIYVAHEIYLGNGSDTTLGVIKNPNGLGMQCQFTDGAINLVHGTRCRSGLPNFIESYFAEPPLQLNFHVPSLDGRLPGEITVLPIFFRPTKTVPQGEKISFEITYDSDLLRILDTPTSDDGLITNYTLDEPSGKISFVVELTKTLDTSQTVVARLPFEILLSYHTDGSIGVVASVLTKTGCAVPTSTTKTPFTLGENCIQPSRLKERSSAAITALYPNPSHGGTTVEIFSHGNPNVELEIVDTFGRVIETFVDAQLQNGHHEMYLHTEKYPNGIYFCRLVHNNSITVKSFIVQR